MTSEDYLWYKEHGICVTCKREDAAPGHTRCLNCLSIMTEKQNERNSKMSEEARLEYNRKARESQRKLREYRRANNLCYRCGKPVYKHYAVCYEHYIMQKRKSRENLAKKKKGYAELGLCRYCGKPVAKGKRLCEEHVEMHRLRLVHAHKKLKEIREIEAKGSERNL